ncbi:hypothetical protein SAMN05421806_1012 [Streptomyces indicus]|uniref:Uncharacterized protein n=1 Tax=Streptomyces indicus TaxID=417292 RepID=A0A1G8T3Z4_9ACTN|nr:hypothetical protein SAMN05421806_1012 [Streptomyces indicus]
MRLRHRLLPVAGVLVLSPLAAEFLIGYDAGSGHQAGMLSVLPLIACLYGTVAVLIREAARRTGRGWPTILLLGTAFGLIQAGLIDQGLFNPAYIDDPSWTQERQATLVPFLGLSAAQLLNFVGGHVIWSFAAPIAVIEACAPRQAGRPWLGRTGIAVLVLLYLAAAAVFHFNPGSATPFTAAPGQLIGTAVVVVGLTVAAFALPRRGVVVAGRVPPPWLVAGAALTVLLLHTLLPATWLGVTVDLVLLSLLGGLLLRWSGRRAWHRVHVLTVGGAALLARAVLAFTVEPWGEADYAVKYMSNALVLTIVVALLAWAWRRTARTERTSADGATRRTARSDAAAGRTPRSR